MQKPLYQPFAEFLASVRASVSSANMLDAAMKARNAEVFLATIMSYIEPDARIIDARNQALLKIQHFAGSLDFGSSRDGTADRARSEAMEAIDAFEIALQDAELNRLGTAIL